MVKYYFSCLIYFHLVMHDRKNDRFRKNIELIGEDKQEILGNSKVAIFGLGGLGNFVSLELTLCGIGSLVLIDRDKVEITNLNRQFLYSYLDIGKSKVEVAKERLKCMWKDVSIETYELDIRKEDFCDILRDVDVIVDCLDNWESRNVLFKTARDVGLPVVHGAVEGWEGQVAFIRKNFQYFAKYIQKVRQGVIAPVVGIIGSYQATLVVQYLIGALKDEFYLYFDFKNHKVERAVLS